MKFLRNHLLVPTITLALLFASSASMAQDLDHAPLSKSAELTFDTVFEQTLLRSPQYLEIAARQRDTLAHQAIGDNWFAGRPSIQLDYIDDRLQSNSDQSELTYGIEMPLWRPGEKRTMQAVGERYSDQTSAWQRAFELTTAGKLRTALADLHESETLLVLEQQATADAQELLRIVEVLFNSGEVAQLEVMQARTLLLTQRRNELEAEALHVDAERNYNVLTGLTIMPATPHSEIISAADSVDLNHPQLQLLQSDIELEESNIVKAETAARGNPTLTLGSRRQKDGPQSGYHNALAVSVNIPFGGKSFVNVAGSNARRAKVDAEVNFLATQRELNTQLHEVEHALFTLNNVLPMAQEQAELSQQQWDMARAAFELGETDMTRVVIAMQQARDSARELENLTLQGQRLITEFNQIIGVLP